MIKPTIFTWIIAIFGAVTFLPLLLAQLFMLITPNDQKTKDLIIGRGAEWRDRTHFKSALAFAWSDWIIIFPLLVAGTTGALLGYPWGYLAWLALGILSLLGDGSDGLRCDSNSLMNTKECQCPERPPVNLS
jgi:hypothetical protein